MNFDLEHLNSLLDDYTQSSKDYGYWMAKAEEGDNTLLKKKEDEYLQNIYGKREEIEKVITSGDKANLVKFGLIDLLESLKAIVVILKNDLENLGLHKKDDPAVFLLENYRQHLIHLIDKSLRKSKLEEVI